MAKREGEMTLRLKEKRGTEIEVEIVKCIENLPDLVTLQLVFLVLYLSMSMYL